MAGEEAYYWQRLSKLNKLPVGLDVFLSLDWRDKRDLYLAYCEGDRQASIRLGRRGVRKRLGIKEKVKCLQDSKKD